MHKAAACVVALLALALAAAAFAGDRTAVSVRLTPTGEGVVARLEFARPVERFKFAYDGGGIRQKTWTLPDGFSLQETIVARDDGAPFTAFEAKIEPSNEPTDATYPCLFRVGPKGLGFYAGYFVGEEEEHETTIEVAPANGQTVLGLPSGRNVWRVDKAFGHNAGHRYVYVGPRDDVAETPHAKLVAPADAPPELATRIRSNLDQTIAYYARATRRPLAEKPLVMIAINTSTKRRGAQGDTTNGPAVALRLLGAGWVDKPGDAARETDHLIAHEAAHFWNSDSFHPAPRAPAWLWEGGADYWALSAQTAGGSLLPSERRKKIERALNACVSALNDRALAATRSSTTYVCGQIVMWVVDASERARTKGRDDIFAVWRRIFKRADENGGLYTLESFLGATTSARDNTALALFLAETGSERWSQLPKRMAPLGVRLEARPPTDDAMRWSAVSHLLDLYCTGSRGAWHEPNFMKLDTSDRCGPLNGDPEVDALNGHSLYSDAAGAFASAAAACANNGDITLTRTGKPDKVTAVCTKPLPTPPPEFHIAATP